MPYGWVAGAVALSAVASYKSGQDIAEATEKGSRTQAEAADKALAFQKEQYADIKPYMQESLKGYQELLTKPESYKETPGYMFRLQEGLKAIGIPEGGRYLSGTQIKAATRYGQDYATGEYNNALARIAGLGDLAQGVGATGQQYASNVGNILMQQGQYKAQGIIGGAQARASGVMGAANALTTGAGLAAGMYGQGKAGTGGGTTNIYNYPTGPGAGGGQ